MNIHKVLKSIGNSNETISTKEKEICSSKICVPWKFLMLINTIIIVILVPFRIALEQNKYDHFIGIEIFLNVVFFVQMIVNLIE